MKLRIPLNKQTVYRALAVLCWLLVWQGAAWLLHQPLLLSSPVQVVQRLFALFLQKGFYRALGFSLLRICGGCLAGMLLGMLLAVLGAFCHAAEYLLHPLMTCIKSVPVASFIILALVWLSSRRLNAFIAFLMVLPIVYGSVLQGLHALDRQLNEMAVVYHIPWPRRFLFIDLPQLKPYLFSAASLAVGMSWKAGIAAEVIGIPSGSIGEMLYQSKIYLDMGGLYAWTLVIVLLSMAYERLMLLWMRRGFARLERL